MHKLVWFEVQYRMKVTHPWLQSGKRNTIHDARIERNRILKNLQPHIVTVIGDEPPTFTRIRRIDAFVTDVE